MDEGLTDIEKIRKRPGMYFGGVDDYGVVNYVLEIFSNAIDAVYDQESPKVVISSLSPNIVIADNGPGFRSDVLRFLENDSITQFSSQKFLEKYHPTPSADNHAPHFHAGRASGVGLVAVNALSEYFHIETWYKGQCWTCEYSKGEVVQPFTNTGHGDGTGSTVSFRPDPEIFTDYTDIHASVRDYVKTMSYLIPGITYEFLNETYHSENGLFDMLHGLKPKVYLDKELAGFRVLVGMGGDSSETQWKSWVNGIHSKEGGSHEEGVRLALEQVNWTPEKIYVHLIGLDYLYAGPTKDKIIAAGLVEPLKLALLDALKKEL